MSYYKGSYYKNSNNTPREAYPNNSDAILDVIDLRHAPGAYSNRMKTTTTTTYISICIHFNIDI